MKDVDAIEIVYRHVIAQREPLGEPLASAVEQLHSLAGRLSQDGFTWEDVELLRSLISFAPTAEFGEYMGRLHSLADRIARELPPQGISQPVVDNS